MGILSNISRHKAAFRATVMAGALGASIIGALSQDQDEPSDLQANGTAESKNTVLIEPQPLAEEPISLHLRWPDVTREDVSQNMVRGVYEFMDDGSLRTILCEGCNDRHHPASLTKMMTLYIMFSMMRDMQSTVYREEFNLSSEAVIPERTVQFYRNGQTNPRGLWFNRSIQGGQELPMRQVLRNIGLQSDAISTDVAASYICQVLACHANNRQHFVEMMNIIGYQLGMHSTQWMDMIGSPADAAGNQEYRHFTTAADLAVLMAELEQEFPEWSRLTMAKDRHVNAGYEWGKTGYTNGNRCLAVLDEHNGRTFVSIVMGAGAPGVREELTRQNIQAARRSPATMIALPSGADIPVPQPNPRRPQPS